MSNVKAKCTALREIHKSTVNQKENIPIYYSTNNRIGMKLVPIIMDYCLLQFDSLQFFSVVRLHGGTLQKKVFLLNISGVNESK